MEHGNDDKGELTLEPVGAVRTGRRRALWGVLGALAVATGALVVTSLGDDGTARPGLPIDLGSARSDEAAGAADSSMPAWVVYEPGDDLPALGGEAPAYRLEGTASEDDVRALAAALGLGGEPVQQDGGWTVTGDAGTLQVGSGYGAQWWFGADSVAGGGGSTGSTGCVETSDDVAVDCDARSPVTTIPACTAADGPAECISGECPPEGPCALDTPTSDPGTPVESDCVAPDGGIVECDQNDQPVDTDCRADGTCPDDTTAPPVDLPAEADARAVALEVVAASGFDVADARVTAEGPTDAWYVTIEPLLDGVPSGLVAAVTVGDEGAIVAASGHVGPAERLGDYPVLDTRATIERANARSGGAVDDVTARPADDAAEGSGPAVGTGSRSDTVVTANDLCPDDPTLSCDEPQITTTSEVQPDCKVQEDGSEICETDGTPGTICPDTVVTANGDPQLGAPESVECTPPPDTTVVPDPAPEPAGPIEIVLVDAEPSLVLLPALDGSDDAYLVPAYRFTDQSGGRVDLPAVADDALTSPTTTDTTVPETGVLPDPGGVEPVEPQPCGPPLVEEDASGTTHTVQPNPDCTRQAERIELMLHCVNIVDWQGMWWSTEAINQPDGWVGKGSVTLEVDGTATYLDDGAPDEPATFVAQGPAEDYPGCD